MTALYARIPSFVCLVVCCTLLWLPASAANLYVWTDSPSPRPPYAGWATAAHTVQDAVEAAQAGDTILVTNGVYATGGRALPGLITINRVAIDRAIAVQSVNGPEVTMIDGANADRCAYVGNGVVLNGFTLTRGVVNYGEGGGVWCESGGVVTNCALLGNLAYNGGGASGGTLYNCTLIENWALISGGGAISSTLFNSLLTDNLSNVEGGGAADATLYRCNLARNNARSGGGAFECVLSNCTITDNDAERHGGGAQGGTLYNCTLAGNAAGFDAGGGTAGSILYNCTLTGNFSEDGGGAEGGTLYNCTLTGNHCGRNGGGADYAILHNCTLVGNQAGAPGGGTFACILTNCVLADNSASGGGGAAGGTLYNCTLAGNSAEVYGGAVVGGTLYNCTLAGNSAGYGGGGAAFFSTLYNCIDYYNSAPAGPNYDEFSTINYSCTTPLPASGAGNIAQEPGFVDLAGGDCHLLLGSPCINAGINQDWMSGATDLDGNPRVSGGIVDMGAYEFQLSATGFITGGGWISSTPGALNPGKAQRAGVAGKATFDFAAKHAKGANAPTGNLEFRFAAQNLNFESTGYDWLMVAGAQAQLKGRGTINRQGNFGFVLTATDGKVNGGGGSDRFRIKVWDEATSTIVYDNQSGSADTADLGDGTMIQGGSIMIHKP